MGHIARNCPKAVAYGGSYGGGGGGSFGAAGGGAGKTCYSCGGYGHMSRKTAYGPLQGADADPFALQGSASTA